MQGSEVVQLFGHLHCAFMLVLGLEMISPIPCEAGGKGFKNGTLGT